MSWENAVVLGIVGVVLVLFWQSFQIDPKHWALRLLTYLMGWAGILLLVGLLRMIVEDSNPTSTGIIAVLNTTWLVMMWIFFLIFLYWMIYHSVEYWQTHLKKIQGERRDGIGKRR